MADCIQGARSSLSFRTLFSRTLSIREAVNSKPTNSITNQPIVINNKQHTPISSINILAYTVAPTSPIRFMIAPATAATINGSTLLSKESRAERNSSFESCISRRFLFTKAFPGVRSAVNSDSIEREIRATLMSTGARNSDNPIPVPTPNWRRLEKSLKEVIVPQVGALPNIRALKIVREQRGLEIADVASFASISSDRLASFERGDREPSRKQMEKLADTYGVPLYSLFGEAVPNLPPLPKDFRKRHPTPASLSPRGIRTLLAVEKISGFAKQLAVELGYRPIDLTQKAKLANSTKRRATELRATFDQWLKPREANLGFSGTYEQRFMGALRLFFEIQGGVLNVNEAPAKDFMGFFVEPAGGLPTIFINRIISSKKAQLFTLAHEYSHALMGLDGISNPFTPRNALERNCNIFAAEFLAPMEQFSAMVEGLPKASRSDTARLVEEISARTLLSKHAAAIRLVEGHYISQPQLSNWSKLFVSRPRQEKDDEREASAGGGGQPHAKRIGELGHLPVFLAKKAVEAGILDAFDVQEELGLSRTLQERAFSLASRRFDLALS